MTRSNRTLITAAVAAAVSIAALVVGATTLWASPSSGATKRIELSERVVKVSFVDLGKKGLSPGDKSVVIADVMKRTGKKTGPKIGRLDMDCTVTGVGARLGGVCHGVLTLPDGQIAGQHAFDKSQSARYQSITGGTGKYSGARGQFVVTEEGSGDTPFVVELAS